jgi:hypothetical protein
LELPGGLTVARHTTSIDVFGRVPTDNVSLKLRRGKFSLEMSGNAPVQLSVAEAAAMLGASWAEPPQNLNEIDVAGLAGFIVAIADRCAAALVAAAETSAKAEVEKVRGEVEQARTAERERWGAVLASDVAKDNLASAVVCLGPNKHAERGDHRAPGVARNFLAPALARFPARAHP